MSVEDRPKSVSHIHQARIFRRPNSPFLWFSYLDSEGRLIRRSAGTAKRPEAWEALLGDYERQLELSFEDAALSYFEKRDGELSLNTLRQYAFAYKAMRGDFEGKLLKEITPQMVRDYIARRQETVSDASIKRELAFLSGLYTFVIEEEGMDHLENPVRKVSKKRLLESSRQRFLSREEYESLLQACHSPLHVNIVKTAVLTGMRHGELLDFQKSWIKWDRHEIHIPAESMKGGRGRVIPMSEELEEVLETQCLSTQAAHVFCYMDRHTGAQFPFTSFKNFFRAACRRAQLEDLRFHDLRHTFGSWWVQADGNLLALKDVMGHTTVKVTERYSHINTNTLHRVRKEVDQHIASTLTRFTGSTRRKPKM